MILTILVIVSAIVIAVSGCAFLSGGTDGERQNRRRPWSAPDVGV
jgi:hypothetical protein